MKVTLQQSSATPRYVNLHEFNVQTERVFSSGFQNWSSFVFERRILSQKTKFPINLFFKIKKNTDCTSVGFMQTNINNM